MLDAVEAAGGADDGVDLSGLNLARLIADGEQVLVGIAPAPGERAAPAHPVARRPGTGPINLNGATAELLDTLPGVGPTLAGRILEWREQHGRFQFRRRAPGSLGHRPQDPRRTRTPGDGVTSDAGQGIVSTADGTDLRLVPAAVATWAGVLVGVAAEDVVLAGIGVVTAVAALLVHRRVPHGTARVAVFVALLCLVSGAASGWARAAGVLAGPVDDLAAAGAPS